MASTATTTNTRRSSVSADIGGTFTDVVRVDSVTGDVVVGKSPTTHAAPAEGIRAALETTDADLSSVSRFLHGTTVGINALLERKGASVGFVTTDGFADMLEIGHGTWPPYRLTWEKPEAIVQRKLCRDIVERVGADGSVVIPLDLQQALSQVDDLVGRNVEVLAVCLMNAYKNPIHELALAEAVQERHPGVQVVLSHQVARRYREYERAVTCISEAHIRPRMSEYFRSLEEGLEEGGFAGELFITSSDGGVMGLGQARTQTLRTLVSGCASGIAGAASLGTSCGYENLICIDMGGTSFDAGIVKSGHAQMSNESQIAGLRLLLPMIELATIGAGGGSIAWVDEMGGLDVGPESAGSRPGPACYGHGGDRATFSDAALVSGLLPSGLLDGAMKLSIEKARTVIEHDVAVPLSVSVDEAASSVVALIEAKMARLLEEITIGRGHDPRDFDLLAYGGGGPLVGSVLGDLLGVRRVIVPRHPGVFSAWGMQTLDIAHEFARTEIGLLESGAELKRMAIFDELISQANERLEGEHIAPEDRTVLLYVELRYDGQEHTLPVPFDPAEGDLELQERFESQHEELYGFRLGGRLEIVGYRVRAIGRLSKPDVPTSPSATQKAMPIGHRTVTHRESGTDGIEWPVYRREDLLPGTRINGPAIIEELTTTTVVTPQRDILVDTWGNLVLEAHA